MPERLYDWADVRPIVARRLLRWAFRRKVRAHLRSRSVRPSEAQLRLVREFLESLEQMRRGEGTRLR